MRERVGQNHQHQDMLFLLVGMGEMMSEMWSFCQSHIWHQGKVHQPIEAVFSVFIMHSLHGTILRLSQNSSHRTRLGQRSWIMQCNWEWTSIRPLHGIDIQFTELLVCDLVWRQTHRSLCYLSWAQNQECYEVLSTKPRLLWVQNLIHPEISASSREGTEGSLGYHDPSEIDSSQEQGFDEVG